jgi:uncharacterized protein YjbI with pentapeptide repeats
MTNPYWVYRDYPKPDDKPSNAPGLDKLVAGANEVAGTARTLFTAMLAVAVTMAATMIAATDEALLRDSAEVFPSLGVRVKLSTAYLMAPIIFLFLHANALLQLHLLGKRLRGLEAEMERLGLPELDRAAWRRTVHGFAFAQAMLGSDAHGPESRLEWLHRLLLAAMSWLAVAVVPMVLLLIAQISFVRYQSDGITFVHKITVFLDLTLLTWLHEVTWGDFTRRHWASVAWSSAFGVAILFILLISVLHATPPKPWELMHTDNSLDAISEVTGWSWTRRHLDLSERTLLESEAKPDLLKPFATGGGTLKEMQVQMVALNLQGRTLRFAKFTDAQLFSADLRGIKAEQSQWTGARLTEARLEYAMLEGANLSNTSLQGSALSDADLRNAILRNANLKGADLSRTLFQGSDLSSARLQGARLVAAELQGANLTRADLQDANLTDANLQGTDLAHSNFQRAVLSNAKLQLSTGEINSCDGALLINIFKDKFTQGDLAAELHRAGLSDRKIKAIDLHIAGRNAALCGTTSLSEQPEPATGKFAQSRLDAACADAYAAKGIETTYVSENAHIEAFNAAWKSATCPAVVAVRDKKR